MDNRRKMDRKDALGYTRIMDRDTQADLGRLEDISPLGFRAVSKEAARPNQKYNVRMTIPSLQDDAVLRCEVLARWCEPLPKGQGYRVGYEFVNLSSKDAEAIENMVQLLSPVA